MNSKRSSLTYGFALLFVLVFLVEQLVLFYKGPEALVRYFALSSEYPFRIGTWITSMFSHAGLLHLGVNTFVFLSFGKELEQRMTRRQYLSLFFICGIGASLIGLLVRGVLLQDTVRFIGASGAIAGFLGYFALRYPTRKIGLLFIIPMTAFNGILIFVLISLVLMVVSPMGIAHSAHIGGVLMGVGFGLYQVRNGEWELEEKEIRFLVSPKAPLKKFAGLFRTLKILTHQFEKPDYTAEIQRGGWFSGPMVTRVTIRDRNDTQYLVVPDSIISWRHGTDRTEVVFKGKFDRGGITPTGKLAFKSSSADEMVEFDLSNPDEAPESYHPQIGISGAFRPES